MRRNKEAHYRSSGRQAYDKFNSLCTSCLFYYFSYLACLISNHTAGCPSSSQQLRGQVIIGWLHSTLWTSDGRTQSIFRGIYALSTDNLRDSKGCTWLLTSLLQGDSLLIAYGDFGKTEKVQKKKNQLQIQVCFFHKEAYRKYGLALPNKNHTLILLETKNYNFCYCAGYAKGTKFVQIWIGTSVTISGPFCYIPQALEQCLSTYPRKR